MEKQLYIDAKAEPGTRNGMTALVTGSGHRCLAQMTRRANLVSVGCRLCFRSLEGLQAV
ncbi:hypothetical protein BDV18DRAFT_139347 [Aspergillus unguis]